DLLGKWWWRFRREGGSLWVMVIKSIHEDIRGLEIKGGRVVCRTRGCGLMAFGIGNEIGLEVLGVGLVRNGMFSVKELARLIEEKVLRVESDGEETIWNNLVPKKLTFSFGGLLEEDFRFVWN
nr:hypothetical protein [Tanacetum cinerariifolium]